MLLLTLFCMEIVYILKSFKNNLKLGCIKYFKLVQYHPCLANSWKAGTTVKDEIFFEIDFPPEVFSNTVNYLYLPVR